MGIFCKGSFDCLLFTSLGNKSFPALIVHDGQMQKHRRDDSDNILLVTYTEPRAGHLTPTQGLTEVVLGKEACGLVTSGWGFLWKDVIDLLK